MSLAKSGWFSVVSYKSSWNSDIYTPHKSKYRPELSLAPPHSNLVARANARDWLATEEIWEGLYFGCFEEKSALRVTDRWWTADLQDNMRTVEKLVDVNFHKDGWFCGRIKSLSSKQVAVSFVNGDPDKRLPWRDSNMFSRSAVDCCILWLVLNIKTMYKMYKMFYFTAKFLVSFILPCKFLIFCSIIPLLFI
jgi:hypothetical protein